MEMHDDSQMSLIEALQKIGRLAKSLENEKMELKKGKTKAIINYAHGNVDIKKWGVYKNNKD